MADNKTEGKQNPGTVDNKTTSGGGGWLEKQLEKLIGRQENMQPIIRALFSIVGFMAGVVVGNWLLGKEKDRRIEAQAQEISGLQDDNEELETELNSVKKKLEESREKQILAETELKVLKEKQSFHSKELNGSPSYRSSHHYLD